MTSRSLAVPSVAVAGLLLLVGSVALWERHRAATPAAAPTPPRAAAARPVEAAPPAPLALRTDSETATGRRVVNPRPSTPPALRVLVREDGSPLANATVVLCSSGWNGGPFEQPTTLERRTEASGLASFDAPDESLDEVLVIAANHAPVRAPRDGTDEQLVVVPGEIALAGVALVDGEPAPGLRLRVEGFRDPSVDWSPAARFVLSDHGLGGNRLTTLTGAGGEFALRGLPAGETVTLTAPDAYTPRDPAEVRAGGPTVRTIDRGVVLDLLRLPTLSGRPALRESGGRHPPPSTPGGHVALVFRFEDTRGKAVETWGSGSVGERFSTQLPCEPDELARASVQLRTDWLGGELLAERTVDGPFTGSYDLGDILIGAERTPLRLRVVERGGGPIAGALALISGRLSEPTDERGEVLVEHGPEDRRLLVGARGYELAKLDLPETPPGPPAPLLVGLEVANRLRVEVLPADGHAPLTGLLLALSIPLPMDDETPEMHGEFASVRGAVPGAGVWSSSGRTHLYELDGGGVLELTDLPVDLELGIEVRDRYEHPVTREEVVLRRGERRVLPLRLTMLPRAIEGRVVGERGEPLPGAVTTLGGFFQEARSGPDGSFRLEGVYTRAPTLTIEAEGHVRLSVVGWDALTRSTFVLEEARTVWVEVLGADGERLPSSVSLVVDDEDARGGTPRSDGLFQFDGVPLRPALVRARADGRTLEVPLDARSTEVTARF